MDRILETVKDDVKGRLFSVEIEVDGEPACTQFLYRHHHEQEPGYGHGV